MAGDLTTEGLELVTAHLKKVGDSQAVVDAALTEHGQVVRGEAVRLAPSASGAARSAITSTYTPGVLVVDAGTAKVPYAYTYHATALGKSKGYMVFRIPTHTRRGYQVTAHKRLRAIPNNAYLFLAWQRKLADLIKGVEAAIAKVVSS